MEAPGQGEHREISSAVFGNRAMIDVIMSIQVIEDSRRVLTTRAVAAHTGMADSVVRPVMTRLVSAKMLTAVPKVGGPRSPQYFSINKSPLWIAVLSVCGEIRVNHQEPQRFSDR